MNLDIWNKVRAVPPEAKKPISGGRLNGKTDINPTWRLKTLTEQFGPCGVGWKYKIVDERMETGAGGEIAAFVDIDLFYKLDGEWSEAIPGTGGSMFVAKEKSGLYTSDECYKMALTDALSVACKALGVAADVYWEKDPGKYSKPDGQPKQAANDKINTTQLAGIKKLCVTDGKPDKAKIDHLKAVYNKYGYEKAEDILIKDLGTIINEFGGKA